MELTGQNITFSIVYLTKNERAIVLLRADKSSGPLVFL